MPNISGFVIDCGEQLWEFFNSGWFPLSILVCRILLPKIIKVFGRSVGH